jgi:predicted P-loop ATPase
MADGMSFGTPPPNAAAITAPVTIIRSLKPAMVCKRYTMGPNGPEKAAVASVTEGAAFARDVPDAAAMMEILAEVTEASNLVICPGAFMGAGTELFRLVDEATLARKLGGKVGEVDGGVHVINGERIAARLKRGISDGEWMLVDADNPPGMPEEWKGLTIGERLRMLDAIIPGISTCERIELRGSSARVVKDGDVPGEPTHAWFRVSTPSRIATLKAATTIAMVTAGLSFVSPRYSRSEPGKVVGHQQRTVVDLSVWDTGRLVFCARPDVQMPGYSVADAGITLVNAGAGALDISGIALPDAPALTEYRERTGHRVELSETNRIVSMRTWGELTLDTEIERRGTTKALRAWLATLKAGDSMRCETPFRASVSEAAVVSVAADGIPRLHDVGSGVTYYLEQVHTADDVMKLVYSIAGRVKREGGSYENGLAALAADPRTATWLAEHGMANNQQKMRRTWDKLRESAAPWLAKCHMGNDGTARGNLHNALIAMREDERLRGVFRRDEMLCATVFKEREVIIPATDVHVGRLQAMLQREGLETVGKDTTHQAVEIVAAENAFHPVRDYLTGLKWDGYPRLGTWLHVYLGVERSEYASAIGKMFMIAMVARVMRPGCQANYMIILEGPQGAKKSTICRILGGQHFSDSMPDIRAGKDVSQHIKGKWLIEVAELSALDKAEAAALKAFVTRDVERYRPSYGRLEVIEPRQCIFIGSTNKAAYLRDETGGRRFWPVKVRAIDAAKLAADRDQLFAEAVDLFNGGAQWWPDGAFERQHIAPQQEKRFEADAWEQAIGEWLEQREKDAKIRHDLPPVTVKLVANLALSMETQKIGRADQNRITAAMERLGWVRGKPTMHSKPWVKGLAQ